MTTQQPYATPRALAEDILLIRRNGGFLTDDEELGERQVLYWIAGLLSELYAQVVASAKGYAHLIDNRLWQPVCLSLVETTPVRGPLTPMPRLVATACLPTNLLSSRDTLLLKDLVWGDYQLTPLPLQTVRQGAIGYGRFGTDRYGWAVAGPTLYATLPVSLDADQPLSGLAVLLPAADDIVDNPDQPIPWLPEWTAEIRRQALTINNVAQQGAPDQVNNGTDKQADKR